MIEPRGDGALDEARLGDRRPGRAAGRQLPADGSRAHGRQAWCHAETKLPALVAADSSALYARNVLDFLKLIVTKEATLNIDLNDGIVAACLMAKDGEVKRE